MIIIDLAILGVIRKNLKVGLALMFIVFCTCLGVTFTLSINNSLLVNSYSTEFFALLANRVWYIVGPAHLAGMGGAVLITCYHINPDRKTLPAQVVRYFVDYRKKRRSPWAMRAIILLATILTVLPAALVLYANSCESKTKYSFQIQSYTSGTCLGPTGSAFFLTFVPCLFWLAMLLWLLICLQSELPVFHYVSTSHIWRPFRKLALSMYLTAYPLLFLYFGTAQQSIYLTPRKVMLTAIAVLLTSAFIGLFFYLLIDIPMRNIEKLVLFPTKGKDLHKKTLKSSKEGLLQKLETV